MSLSEDEILVQADLIRQRRRAEADADRARREAEARRTKEEQRRAKIQDRYEEMQPFEPLVIEGEIYDTEPSDSHYALLTVENFADTLDQIGEGQWVRVTIELIPPRFPPLPQ